MTDPFLWLEELDSPQSLAWVKSQNEKTLSQWSGSQRFQDLQNKALELLSHKDKVTAGQVFQNQVYFLWQDAQNPLGLWQRAPLSEMGANPKWEVLIDLDELSRQKSQATFLKSVEFLEGSSRVLLALAPDGKDTCVVREWDLGTRDFVENGFKTSLSKDYLMWVNENQVLWSSTQVPTHCGYSSLLYSWKRGESPQLLHQVPTSHMNVWSQCLSDSNKKPEVFVFDHVKWDESVIFHWQDQKILVPTDLPPFCWIYGLFRDRLVIWLEKQWQGFSAGSVLISKTAKKLSGFFISDFEPVFQPEGATVFQSAAFSKEGIALVVSENLKNQIRIWTPEKYVSTEIPEGATVSSVYSSVEENQLFSLFQSFTEPVGWYQWSDPTWKPLQKAKSHFQTENVIAKQVWATSHDGTQVPYWIVYDKRFSGPRPTLQLGYGGFLHAMYPTYSGINGALWIERGGAFVLAQIRGGSEFGPAWHQAARLENKQKSYDDFIAISEDLIQKGYTSSKQLAIRGRSNGGLLVGATITQRPDLYGSALIEVPLLDMIRYVELPPGSSWIQEYGDPRDPQFREIILKYSPYQNIEKNSKYPPILIRTARSDDRVHPGHARKMAAKMQSLGHQVFFFEEELGGHGSTPIKDQAFQHALVFEFLWRNLSKES